jgi:hypothetical protein
MREARNHQEGDAPVSETTDFVAIARELGPAFAARAAEHDAADSFVSEN